PFRICKLRTMTGANDAALFASDESHRITRLGAFLRAKRIDELPQVWNVLLGQMSFIGPRPEQPKFYEEFAQTIHQYNLRQVVKPGISGLAQVKSGYADDQDSTRAKLRYDLHYIRNMNAGMDAYIIARTFRVLITGFGAK
ncbi:MAG: sugar transferase, partial [Pseudomonadota bacterium]